jgi:hypothetical protein
VSEPVPALVTLHVWRVTSPARALLRAATDRRRARSADGARFAKLLGTGDGTTFTSRDADPRTWALLVTWAGRSEAEAFERSDVVEGWGVIAEETWRVELAPVSSHGRWSRREPFGAPVPRKHDGPVAAITRARLAPTRTRRFWAAVPPVSADLRQRPGLLAALGIGESPVALQGTFSLWASGEALRDFAHRGAAHQEVVARTPSEAWYAEELFARFAVVGSRGTLQGRDPLAAA